MKTKLFSNILHTKDLLKIRKKLAKKKLVYCSGTFDLAHLGHAMYFEYCRNLGDTLIVNVGSDADIRRNKGPDKPILNQKIRVRTVSLFRAVDYCFIGPEFKEGQHPMAWLEDILRKLHPDIYVYVKNKNAKRDLPVIKDLARKYNTELIVTNKTFPAISTTKIIEKILTGQLAK